MTSAIILGGGSSQRMNGTDKQLMLLEGVPVIIRSALAFEQSELTDEIVIVTRETAVEEVTALCKAYKITKLKAVVSGGETRAESAKKGAAVLDKPEIVAIHDGARPLVTPSQIDSVIAAAKEHSAAILAIPATDTVKSANDGIVAETLPREALWLAQTPQAFSGQLYAKMLEQEGEATDDSMLAEKCGARVHIVSGSSDNLKITTPTDIAVARALLKVRREQKNA